MGNAPGMVAANGPGSQNTYFHTHDELPFMG